MNHEETTRAFADPLARERLARRIFAELNQFVDLKPALGVVIGHLRTLTGCQSIGIRLREGNDFPYLTTDGLSEDFVRHESSLCRPMAGEPLLDGAGRCAPELECFCGAVLRGEADPSLPFTAGGSLWLNETTRLLDAPPDELGERWHVRAFCPAAGYQSVALVPIRARGERIGLLQLNDRRPAMFTEHMIEFLEMIGEHAGLAIQNAQAYTRLKEAHDEIRLLQGIMPLCFRCRKVRDDQGYWHDVQEYVRRQVGPDSAHGLCPECAGRLYMEVTRSS